MAPGERRAGRRRRVTVEQPLEALVVRRDDLYVIGEVDMDTAPIF